MEYAIRIKGLTKAYKIYSSPLKRIFDTIFHKKHDKEFTALQDISIDIPKGEVIGILGKNGSGKRTACGAKTAPGDCQNARCCRLQ